MTKVNVLLTSDKATVIIVLGDVKEKAPALGLDLKEGKSIADGLSELESLLKSSDIVLRFVFGGGPYDKAHADELYSPEKVAEYDIENPDLEEFYKTVTA